MNKKIIIIFALVLAVTVVFSVTAGAQAPTIAVSSVSAKPGDTVELMVSVSGNPGINTFSLGFEYDTDRLTLQNVTASDALGGQFTYAKKAVWLNSSDSTYNGEILTLSFKVNDNATAGNASVNVTYSAGDISNYNEDDVNFGTVPGAVTVTGGETGELGDVDLNGKIDAEDARLALRAAAKLQTLTGEQFARADVDGNGDLNAIDARKILRVAAKLESF